MPPCWGEETWRRVFEAMGFSAAHVAQHASNFARHQFAYSTADLMAVLDDTEVGRRHDHAV